MANDKHVEILKQGAKVWNTWRENNLSVELDLAGADLSYTNLSATNLSGADLRHTNFRAANLRNTDFRHSDFSYADFYYSDLYCSNLHKANLSEANLNTTNLRHSNLSAANLSGTNLNEANFSATNLSKTNFNSAVLSRTVFSQVNLSNTKALELCIHKAPSSIDNHTLQQSELLPPIFLKGIGLANWEIEQTKLYQKDLDPYEASDIFYKIHELRFNSLFQIHNLFISYTHLNTKFVDNIATSIDKKGIRFWRDTKDLPDAPAGPLGKVILKEMKGCIVLLVLSKESVSRPWVRFEIENAAKMEVEEGREVLLPIALDDAWKTYNWPIELANRIKRYNIIDFSNWQDEDIYNQRFEQVLRGLDLFYKNDV